MNLKNIPNQYQQMLGRSFDHIPKAVFAAIAVSFIILRDEEAFQNSSDKNGLVLKEIMREWSTLNGCNIIPQIAPELPRRPRKLKRHGEAHA